jgi:hypothetical protein
MLSESQVLDSVSGADVTYKLIKSSSDGTTRIDVATNATAPALMTIKHSVSGRGADAIDRHLVQFSRTVLETSGAQRTATVNFTVAVPRSSVITSTIVKDLICNLADLIADGVIASMATTNTLDALLRGES